MQYLKPDAGCKQEQGNDESLMLVLLIGKICSDPVKLGIAWPECS